MLLPAVLLVSVIKLVVRPSLLGDTLYLSNTLTVFKIADFFSKSVSCFFLSFLRPFHLFASILAKTPNLDYIFIPTQYYACSIRRIR